MPPHRVHAFCGLVVRVLCFIAIAIAGTLLLAPTIVAATSIAKVPLVTEAVFDLAISKTAPPGPFYVGQLITYTLAYTNAGPEVATGAEITDVLPTNAQFVSASSGCKAVSASNSVRCAVGTVGAGISGSLRITIRAPGITASPSVITNTATITATGETTPTDNVAIASSTIYRLSLTSICSVQANVSRQWRTTNNGPLGVTFDWQLAGTGVRGSEFISANSQLFFTTPAGGQDSTLIISINGVQHDVKASAGSCPDLTISKTASPTLVWAGDVLTYTLRYLNLGPNAAGGVAVVDVLPQGVSFGGVVSQPVNLGAPVQSNQTLTWNVGSLNANVSGTIVFTANVAIEAPQRITNTAAITSTTPEPNPANNTASAATTIIVPIADVYVRKTVSPSSAIVPGVPLTWTLAFGNAGNYTASAVLVEDLLPDNVVFGGVLSQSAEVSGPLAPSPALQWLVPQLAPGASGSIEFTATAIAGLQNVVSNTATITTTTRGNATDNDQATTVTPIIDFAIDKAVARTPVLVGDSISFTVRITNTGALTLTKFALTDTYDLHILRLEDVGPLDALTQLAPNASASVVLTFTALQSSNGVLTLNTISATAQSGNAVVPTRSSSVGVRVVQAGLNLFKTSHTRHALGHVQPGERITYTIVISNSGDADAEDVVISDTLPLHTRYVTDSLTIEPNLGPARPGQPPLLTNALSVAAGTATTVTFAVIVDSPLLSGTLIANTAEISAAPGQIQDATSTVTNVVHASHAVAVHKAASAHAVLAGSRLTYTIGYAIGGDEPALDVTVTDALPPDLNLVASLPAPTRQSGNVLAWSLGNQSPPTSAQIVVVVDVPTNTITGTLLTNTATISDGTGLSATSSVTTTVTVPVSVTPPVTVAVDLAISKSAEPLVVKNGGLVTYTLIVTNHGPADLPAENGIFVPGALGRWVGPASPYPATIFVGDADVATITDLTVTLSLMTHTFSADTDVLLVGPNGQRVMLMSDVGGVQAIAGATVQFHDGAPLLSDYLKVVSGVYAPTDFVGNDGVESLSAPAPARPYSTALAAFKGSSANGAWQLYVDDDQDNDDGVVIRGWTLTLATTAGPRSYSFGHGPRVVDVLPPGFFVVAATPGFAGPNPLVWVDGLRAGETRVLTVTGKASYSGSASITNTATVTGTATAAAQDTNLSNNTSSAAISITYANVSVLPPIVQPKTPPQPGETLTITLPIENNGNVPATGLAITMTVPPDVVLDNLPPGWVQVAPGVYVFSVAALPPGSGAVVVPIQLPNVMPPGGSTLPITIVIGDDGATGADPNPADNVINVFVPIDVTAQFTFGLQSEPASGASVRVGDRITYTLLITNTGGVTMTDLVLRSAVPLNTVLVPGSLQPARWANVFTGSDTSSPLEWRIATLAPKQSTQTRFAVQVTSLGNGLEAIQNTAQLQALAVALTASNTVTHFYLPTAIELVSFVATPTDVGGVRVAWRTGAEIDTFGFVLYRVDGAQADVGGEQVLVTPEVIAAAGAGSTYTQYDTTARPGHTYSYWLHEIETGGRVNVYGPVVVVTRKHNASQMARPKVYLPLVAR